MACYVCSNFVAPGGSGRFRLQHALDQVAMVAAIGDVEISCFLNASDFSASATASFVRQFHLTLPLPHSLHLFCSCVLCVGVGSVCDAIRCGPFCQRCV
jgi:hypothetical protein